jgi:hypothetical protein
MIRGIKLFVEDLPVLNDFFPIPNGARWTPM